MKRISLTCLAAAVTLLSGSQAYSQSGPFRTASWSNNSHGGVQFSSSDYVPASFPGDGGCQDCQGGYSEWAGADEVACMDGNCETSEAKRRHRLGGMCGTKAYPDSGWAPPAHNPVNRDGVWYQNYTPQIPYGSPGGGFVANYQQIYQPNDTAQMGYTYQSVPTWQPRPGMIPGPPIPSNFHDRSCPGGNCGSYAGMVTDEPSVTDYSSPSSHWRPVSWLGSRGRHSGGSLLSGNGRAHGWFGSLHGSTLRR